MEVQEIVEINAPVATVWQYLTTPTLVKEWIAEPEMEIEIFSDWKVGSLIIIKGFHHISFENKGVILQFKRNKVLQYSHLSSLSRLPDSIENYSIITFQLEAKRARSLLKLNIRNFPTETIFKHLDFYWKTTVGLIKKKIEDDISVNP